MLRRTRKRKEYKIFVLVCEGGKTEPIYFKHYRKHKTNLRIKIPNSRDTDPVNLVEFAKRQIEKYEINTKYGDRIWCVFDVDNNKAESIEKAISLAKPNIKIILSNPCFEIWFLLHFVYWECQSSCQDVIDKLKNCITDYSKTKDIFDLILDKRDDAIKFAKRLNQYHLKNDVKLISVESNPSTQVFNIVEYILEVTKCYPSFS